MQAPTHVTARQIRNMLKGVLASTCNDPFVWLRSVHRQRITREIIKLGAQKWHGEWMLDSTAATQFIASHVPDNAQGCDTQDVDTTRPNGDLNCNFCATRPTDPTAE